MRKRKGSRSEASTKTLFNSASSEEAPQFQQHHRKEEEEGSAGHSFFACYLLASLNPRFKGHTYIGFTVNPRRRIRQHNGEIGCGAWKTKKKRPWEMVLCIYGFPTNVSALQFEWAWQHPVVSLAVRQAAAGFKSISGVANKIKLAYTMLTLPSWQGLNITVNFFSTKYTKHSAGCPSLPEHMNVEIGSMDELPCYNERIDGLSENENDSIDEAEFDNDTSNSNPVCDDSSIHDSSKSMNHRDKISESLGRNQESEAREPAGHSCATQDRSLPFSSITLPTLKRSPATSLNRVEIIEGMDFVSMMKKSRNQESEAREPLGHSFATQDWSPPFGSIASLASKSSPATSLNRVEIIEDTEFVSVMNKSRNQESTAREPAGHSTATQDRRPLLGSITSPTSKPSPATSLNRVEIITEGTGFASVMNKSSTELCQPECELSGAVSATGENEVSNTFIVPLEAEIIDLSTPSPSCRNVLDNNKKRRVSSCVGADFIDLTKSPNFVQL